MADGSVAAAFFTGSHVQSRPDTNVINHRIAMPLTIVIVMLLVFSAIRKAIVPAVILGTDRNTSPAAFSKMTDGATSAARTAGGIYRNVRSRQGGSFP